MFRGSIPALVTPFRDGKVDEAALVELVNWHVAEGSHGIVAVGTTGETPTLSHEEHEHCIEVVVETAAGRIPVIAGAGSNNTAESVRLMRFAATVGADAALVVTPYYNKPSQRGLYHHFKALHDAVDLPILIYNIPGRSIVDMTPETMGELAKLPRIIGVKDATGDVSRVSDTRIACGREFIQLSGEDASALGFNAHGGTGCISVVANIAPRLSLGVPGGDARRRLRPGADLPGPADAAAPRRLRRAEPGADQVRAVAARQVHRRGPLADGAARGGDPGADARRDAPRGPA